MAVPRTVLSDHLIAEINNLDIVDTVDISAVSTGGHRFISFTCRKN